MESVPGNPNPDLVILLLLISIQYGIILVLIGLAFLSLWLAAWFKNRKKSSSSDPRSTPSSADEWFSPEGQKELYRDFNLN